MRLTALTLANFKNIASATLELSPKINCFLGDNGMGKSNLLDALYLLSYCRSFTGVTDTQLIKRGEDFAIVNGRYLRRGIDEELNVAIRPGRRKSFKRAGKEYKRIADHLGAFPLVLLSPADFTLTAGEPSERRRLMDQISSQSDPRYLEALVRYGDLLERRNRLLRDQADDAALYEALEIQMDAAAAYLCRRRRECVEALLPVFRRFYTSISGTEVPGLEYLPSLRDAAGEPGAFAEKLAAVRSRDLILGYTSSGPHRDDLDMTLDGAPVRRVASQGQTKTYTSALRFAQYELLHTDLGLQPLLLLDDIFDKLDAGRVERIIATVADSAAFGQIFITDTNRRHLDEIVGQISATGAPSRLWSVDSGRFSLLEV